MRTCVCITTLKQPEEKQRKEEQNKTNKKKITPFALDFIIPFQNEIHLGERHICQTLRGKSELHPM